MVSQGDPDAVRISPYDDGTGGPVVSPMAVRDGLSARISAGWAEDTGSASYQLASALMAETDAVCGGSWWTGLFRRDLHSA